MQTQRGQIKAKRRVLASGVVVFNAFYEVPGGGLRSAGTVKVVKSEAAARTKARELAHEAGVKAWAEGTVDNRNRKITVDEYYRTTWFKSLNDIEVKTRQNYASVYGNHIKPVFGHKPLRAVLPTHVKTWLNDMEERGVGGATRLKALLVLGMLYRAARGDEIVSRDVTEDVKKPKVDPRKVVIFTPEQWDKFYAELPEYWKPLAYVGVWTGLRVEELRALQPAHIQWHLKQIHVVDATAQVSGKQNGGQVMVDKDTKSHKDRYVDFDHPALPAKVGQMIAKEIMARGLSKDSTERLFATPEGKPFRQETLWEVFKETCERAGIPHRTPKDMRSTRASWLLQACGDVMYVKDQLGHASITTTQKYLAFVNRQKKDTDTSFEDFLADEG